MKKYFLSFLAIAGIFLSGCGYTTNSLLASKYRTIYVEPIKNNVEYTTEGTQGFYVPLMEVKIRNAIVDRFLFDGNLKVAKPDTADIIIKGELTGYERNVIRYTDGNDPEEYRIHVVMNLTFFDRVKNEAVWTETGFTGEATYFVTGPLTKSEGTAVEDAITDLARRVVERGVEDW